MAAIAEDAVSYTENGRIFSWVSVGNDDVFHYCDDLVYRTAAVRSSELVFKGTRFPVRQVADVLPRYKDIGELRSDFSSLDAFTDAELTTVVQWYRAKVSHDGRTEFVSEMPIRMGNVILTSRPDSSSSSRPTTTTTATTTPFKPRSKPSITVTIEPKEG